MDRCIFVNGQFGILNISKDHKTDRLQNFGMQYTAELILLFMNLINYNN